MQEPSTSKRKSGLLRRLANAQQFAESQEKPLLRPSSLR
jgi:hypothetical protein